MSQDEQDEWVRRALASARSDEPVPEDVAARLDQRLAALRAERPVPRGRRRLAPLVLAAAAVAAVVAVGVPVVQHLGSSSPAGSASTASARRPATPTPSAPPTSTGTAAGGEARMGLTGDTPQLRSAAFGSSVTAALPQLLEAAQAYALAGEEAASSCQARPAAGTRGALVLLDGQPALAEISAPSDGRRTVRALSCSDATPLATARVAAR